MGGRKSMAWGKNAPHESIACNNVLQEILSDFGIPTNPTRFL